MLGGGKGVQSTVETPKILYVYRTYLLSEQVHTYCTAHASRDPYLIFVCREAADKSVYPFYLLAGYLDSTERISAYMCLIYEVYSNKRDIYGHLSYMLKSWYVQCYYYIILSDTL